MGTRTISQPIKNEGKLWYKACRATKKKITKHTTPFGIISNSNNMSPKTPLYVVRTLSPKNVAQRPSTPAHAPIS